MRRAAPLAELLEGHEAIDAVGRRHVEQSVCRPSHEPPGRSHRCDRPPAADELADPRAERRAVTAGVASLSAAACAPPLQWRQSHGSAAQAASRSAAVAKRGAVRSRGRARRGTGTRRTGAHHREAQRVGVQRRLAAVRLAQLATLTWKRLRAALAR